VDFIVAYPLRRAAFPAGIAPPQGSLGAPVWTGCHALAPLSFSVIGGLTILPILALIALLPDRPIYAVGRPYSVLLDLLRLAGVVGLVYGVQQTGFMNFIGLDRVLDPAAVHRPPRLVTNGLYRWVRHPLYTSAFLLLWAAPELSWNNWPSTWGSRFIDNRQQLRGAETA